MLLNMCQTGERANATCDFYESHFRRMYSIGVKLYSILYAIFHLVYYSVGYVDYFLIIEQIMGSPDAHIVYVQ